jgi:hypothetical protein
MGAIAGLLVLAIEPLLSQGTLYNQNPNKRNPVSGLRKLAQMTIFREKTRFGLGTEPLEKKFRKNFSKPLA